MALEFDILEGLDPTPLPEVNASEILQITRQAAPRPHIGFIYVGPTAPDILNNPRYTRYGWADTSTDPATLKLYKFATLTWEPVSIGANSVTTASIVNAAVTLAKIAPGGVGSKLWILRTNAAGTGVEWWQLIDPVSGEVVGFQNNSLSTNVLIKSATPGDLFRSKLDGSGVEWFALSEAEILSRLSDLSIAVAKLTGGTPKQIIQQVGGYPTWIDIITAIDDNLLTLDKLNKGTAQQGNSIRVKADNTGWEFYTPVASQTTQEVYDNIALPALTDWITGHTLGALPDNVHAVIKRINAGGGSQFGYNVDDEVPLNETYNNTTETRGISLWMSASDLGGRIASQVRIQKKILPAVYEYFNIDHTLWVIKVTIQKFA